jgi:dynein heavy chain
MVLMSPELDQMYTSLLTNQVPANWATVAYSSLKPLASWFKDLHKRVDFMRQWMAKGHPKAYWLSGFFFPHGFLTGVLQAFARKHQKAIDFLKFKFNFMAFRDSTYDDVEDSQSFTITNELALIEEPPKDGVYIYGLHIESATWSYTECCVTEQEPGVIVSAMPMVHFLPFEVKHTVELQPPSPTRGGRDGLPAEDTKSKSSG